MFYFYFHARTAKYSIQFYRNSPKWIKSQERCILRFSLNKIDCPSHQIKLYWHVFVCSCAKRTMCNSVAPSSPNLWLHSSALQQRSCKHTRWHNAHKREQVISQMRSHANTHTSACLVRSALRSVRISALSTWALLPKKTRGHMWRYAHAMHRWVARIGLNWILNILCVTVSLARIRHNYLSYVYPI